MTSTPSTQEVADLVHKLRTLGQEAPGFISNHLRFVDVRYGSRGSVQSPTQLEAAERVRKDVALLGPGIMIVYFFAMFEEHLPYKLWSDRLAITPDKVQRLQAYRHIRHTFAHSGSGVRGKRSKDDLNAFETVMKSTSPLPGVTFTPTHITALPPHDDVTNAMKAVALEAVSKVHSLNLANEP